MTDHYTTPTKRIGKHTWRCVVYQHAQYGRCTRWEWATLAEPTRWRHHREWPRYDINDTYDGLPRSLGPFYQQHLGEIYQALGRTPRQLFQERLL